MPIRIGVDIGGTFTDLMLVDTISGKTAVEKVLTTPHAPEQGVLVGVQRILRTAAIEPAAVDNITHGTTLVTNALIERKGARSALLTTEADTILGAKDIDIVVELIGGIEPAKTYVSRAIEAQKNVVTAKKSPACRS